MNNSPLPQEEDPNVIIDAEIERRLFEPEFVFRELYEDSGFPNWELDYKEPDELPNQL